LGSANFVGKSQHIKSNSLAKCNFIPFDSISKPSLDVRRNLYLKKLEDDNLKNDPKLQARLGLSMKDGEMIHVGKREFDPQSVIP
jgi:hypothetical protein